MSASARPSASEPFGQINTTPLIDVMLVLLIMFIITIPVATHSIDLDLPRKGGPIVQPDPVKNRLAVTASGSILWNAQPVSESQLAAVLEDSLRLPVEPELQFRPEAEAPYDVSARVMGIVKATGVTNFGFVGNEAYARFGK